MRVRQFASVGLLLSCAVGGTLVGAQQPGVGQTPSSLPLTAPIRERGSSVTPAFEGWYFDKDGSQRVLVGYFNRNTKQEFDIPAGPNNRIEPGPPDQGQPTHFNAGRQWGVFTIKLPKDFGTKKLSWTIVANGFTNTITLHTNADYIIEPFEDAANKNTPPKLKFQANGPIFTGPPQTIAEKYTGTVGVPLPLPVWISDEGPKINVPEPSRGRGRGAAAASGGRRRGCDRRHRSDGRPRRRARRGSRRIHAASADGAHLDEVPRARRREVRQQPPVDRSRGGRQGGDQRDVQRARATTSCGSRATTAPARAAAASSAAGRTPTSRHREAGGRDRAQSREVAVDMRVLKFGGSSLATPATIREVGRILLDARRREPVIGVVSAFQGVTNQLLECARLAERADGSFEDVFEQIARRHRSAVSHLVGTRAPAGDARAQVDALLAELRSTLQGIHLLRHCPPRALDMTASFGERLSALIVAAHLDQTPPVGLRRRARLPRHRRSVHPRQRPVPGDQPRAPAPTSRGCSSARSRSLPIVTGFIGATADGQTTTIGRNGSDYSAAIVGAAIGASVIEIWTDVDGVLSADPRIVPAAFVLPQMTYEEAMELSYFGAKVLHSATIAPAVAKRIPILIKNTFNPDAPGTLISRKAVRRRQAGEGDHVGRRPGAADAARPGHGRRAGRGRPRVPDARVARASTSS